MVDNIKLLRGRSWGLSFSIILFLLCDICLLGLNFRITKDVSEDALIINLAGRQRMLSQQMSKVIFQINSEQITSTATMKLVDEFQPIFRLFNRTLDAFNDGGITQDAELNPVRIRPLTAPKASEILQQTRALLHRIHVANHVILEQGITIDSYLALRHVLASSNDELLSLMNRLTVLIENSSHQQVSQLRALQLFAFVLALINFAIIVYLFRKANKQSKDLIDTFDDLFQSTNVALIVFLPSKKVSMCNQFACDFFGYSYRELQRMSRSSLIVQSRNKNETKCLTRDGRQIDVEIHERVVHRGDKTLNILTILDISSHVKKGLQDPLTGILNRHALNRALQHKSEQVYAFGGRFACFFLDLNDFKLVNDRYGHDAGDSVLKSFSQRLRDSLDDSGLLYRFGGDEFILLVDLCIRGASIERTHEKIDAISQRPIRLPNQKKVTLSLSAGVAVFPDDTRDTEELITLADKSMYRMKHRDKDTSEEISDG